MRHLLLLALLASLCLGASPAKRPLLSVEVLYTSDLHGHIDRGQATFLNPEFPPPLGGGASAAAYIARVRADAARESRRVLLLDSGDLFQGTPLGATTRGGAVIEWMNRMRYDAATLGNHDFDLGRDNTERLARMAQFPVLAANLYDSSTGQRVDWVRDHVMLEIGGVRIAVLGYITEATVQMAFARNIAGLEFRRVDQVMPADVRRVREAGADLVFVLLHHGLPYRLDLESAYRRVLDQDARGDSGHFGMDAMELAHRVRGVDAIFSGHTHQGYDQPWEDPVTHTLVLEPFANGSSLGHVTLEIDPPTRSLIGFRSHFDRGALLTLLEDEMWPDTTEAEIIGRQVSEAEQGLDVRVGRTTVTLQSGAAENALMGFVMADAFREELGADLAIQNTGGVRGTLVAGPITRRDLLAVAPFENQMLLAQVPGGMVRDLIEDKLAGRGGGIFVSGARVRYDDRRPDHHRLVELTIGDAPLDTARIYKVALTDYLAEGNSGLGRLRQLPPESFQPAGFTDREVLTRYVERRGVLSPSNDGRWIKVTPPLN